MTVADLPPGVTEVRYVRSESRPEHEYRMFRTRGGWHHGDATCPGFNERGECRHVDELNEEPGTELVVVDNALSVVDDLESEIIIASLAGKVSETWVYEFQQGGSPVVGLSTVGVDQASRYMATKGEALRIIDCHIEHEDDKEARFFAVAGRYAVSGDGKQVLMDTATGAKRQPKYMKLRNGGEKFNENWYEIGNTKACRNAKAKLIADEVRQHIIAEARGQSGRVQTVQEQQPRGKQRQELLVGMIKARVDQDGWDATADYLNGVREGTFTKTGEGKWKMAVWSEIGEDGVELLLQALEPPSAEQPELGQ